MTPYHCAYDYAFENIRLGRARTQVAICLAIAALCDAAQAGGEQELEKVTVTGSSTNLVGVADRRTLAR